MTEDGFWEIVEACQAASHGDFAEQVRLQRARLMTLPLDELVSFQFLWEAIEDRAFTWPVWDAAALLLGGCGDDSFCDFRAWLIGQGRQVFEQVVNEPDRLAEVADRWTDVTHSHAETYGLQILSVYEKRTGSYHMPEQGDPGPLNPAGVSVNVGDERIARAHFPRLAEFCFGPGRDSFCR
ncbi:DUF4240 domain-containing protein [Actinomadura sp. 9N407]|uniref:DUF4240 domain-containing protein n=1 Tax=Actinomadura sp. 9N407 TaxID=3375154 RepID=UPI0037BCAE1D